MISNRIPPGLDHRSANARQWRHASACGVTTQPRIRRSVAGSIRRYAAASVADASAPTPGLIHFKCGSGHTTNDAAVPAASADNTAAADASRARAWSPSRCSQRQPRERISSNSRSQSPRSVSATTTSGALPFSDGSNHSLTSSHTKSATPRCCPNAWQEASGFGSPLGQEVTARPDEVPAPACGPSGSSAGPTDASPHLVVSVTRKICER